MELTNEFEVAVPVAEAWAVLTDVEKIAPCLPGAELKEVEGDEYRGVVKVKVGPITATYKGAAHFEELDAKAHRAVLKAEGRESRGQGNASATITATLTSAGKSTKVSVVTELAITGKVAQFGRGVLADVSGKLLDQFVQNLETQVLAPQEAAVEEAIVEVVEATVVEEVSEVAEEIAEIAEAAAEAVAEAVAEEVVQELTAELTPELGEELAEAVAEAVAEEIAEELEEELEAEFAAELTEAVATELAEEALEELAEAVDAAEAAETGEADGSAGGDDADKKSAKPSIRRIDSAPAEPVDLVGVAGPSLAKRLVPFASIAGGLFLLRIVVYALKRRKK